MSIVNTLRDKGCKVKKVPAWGVYLRKQWENVFADHLSHEEKRSIYMYDEGGACGFLWHVFSYEKRSCLLEGEADRAFNKEAKSKCFLFYQHSDDVLFIENAWKLSPDDLRNEMDVYVVDKEFTWTYVKTHETGWCGPYFSRK